MVLHLSDHISWQEWHGLTEERRDVIRNRGWEYFRMPVWRQGIHSQFPVQLRVQVAATLMAIDRHLPRESNAVLGMLARALDAYDRCMPHAL